MAMVLPVIARKIIHAAFLIAIVIFASACSSADRSEGVVPDSTLALVLADLHLVGARLKIEVTRDSLTLSSIADASVLSPERDSVLSVYGLSEEEFMAAMEPYLEEPTRYVALYNRVLDHLNSQRQQIALKNQVPK